MAAKRAKKSAYKAKRTKKVSMTPKKKKALYAVKKDFIGKCLDIFN